MMDVSCNPSIHIGFVCKAFLTGWSGVERLVAQLAAALVARGHRVTLLACPPVGTVSKTVPLTALPAGCALLEMDPATDQGCAQLRQDLLDGDFDVLVAPCANRDFLRWPWLAANTGIPLISAESIHPTDLSYQRMNPYEHYAAMAGCDRVQVLLPGYRDFYPAALHDRIAAIGNPAPPPQAADWAAREKKRVLLAVGRLDEPHKRFSLLLRAWALLKDDFPDWSLTLVGDGPSRPLYQALAGAMGPDARVSLPGSVADPGPYYAAASLFCIPSLGQEGFPLVLGEAAAHSLPLVGFTQCDAVAALVAPGCGVLAEQASPAALAETLRPLMAAPGETRQAMGQAARDWFQTHYAADLVFDQWEALLTETAQARGNTRLDRLRRDAWTAELLDQAALELVSRPDPLTEGTTSPQAALARLQSRYDSLEQAHGQLQRKYEALLRQTGQGRPNQKRR